MKMYPGRAKTLSRVTAALCSGWLMAVLVHPFVRAADLQVVEPLVFTDERARVEFPGVDGKQHGQLSLLTWNGWQPERTIVLDFVAGKAGVEPLGEGIHMLRIDDGEARFLAVSPPPELKTEAVRAALPRSAENLLGSKPFIILAMGDSVTATGSYPEIFRRMLSRATGNSNIGVVVKAHPGCSVDASVRTWEKDGAVIRPDLGLIMYGLNDEAIGVALPAFVDQLHYLVDRLHEVGADAVLLEPTPHINITPLAGDKSQPPPSAAIFRTIGFAGAIHSLAQELNIPVARTFDAIWQGGGADLPGTARKLWPTYPLSYAKPFTTMLDTGGKGDTIHPNALGHLALAKAVFAAIGGSRQSEPLAFSGSTSWREGALISSIVVSNRSEGHVAGRLAIYPLPEDDRHIEVNYSLGAHESQTVEVAWPDVSNVSDLLEGRYALVFDAPGPFVQVVDYRDGGSHVTAVNVPMQPAIGWVRERRVADHRETFARLDVQGTIKQNPVTIPESSEVGRIPLFHDVRTGDQTVPVAAELVYVRFGAAAEHEASVDGDLSEWQTAQWIPVGEPVQARPQDHRRHPGECYLHWAFSAGKNGVFLAFRGSGKIGGDLFTIYFDPRKPEELGLVGPYYWVDGSLAAAGNLDLKAGDSSPPEPKPVGAWKMDGEVTHGEVFVPYALIGRDSWPSSGDLGLSIVWHHQGLTATRLMWSENGHPWNTRWFGVVRRGAGADRPFMVRVQ